MDDINRRPGYDKVEEPLLNSNLGIFCGVIQRGIGWKFVTALQQLTDKQVDDIHALIEDFGSVLRYSESDA